MKAFCVFHNIIQDLGGNVIKKLSQVSYIDSRFCHCIHFINCMFFTVCPQRLFFIQSKKPVLLQNNSKSTSKKYLNKKWMG